MKSLEKMTKAELIAAYQTLATKASELMCQVDYLEKKINPKVASIDRLRDGVAQMMIIGGDDDKQIAKALNTTPRVIRKIRNEKMSIKMPRGRPKKTTIK